MDEQIVGLGEPAFAVLAVQLHFDGTRSVVTGARRTGPLAGRGVSGQNRKHDVAVVLQIANFALALKIQSEFCNVNRKSKSVDRTKYWIT